ncbi:sulfide/dihydroorotate dehydrogenase-like FAD/NAD-binding protein [Clostridium sp.]|uniref:sulfide/dihydroorotate dehydrogenase-like FAD/NAD-binding protein n=1 Tax=Clostridium sp. TaxID=1506 RepID=UPI002A9140B5|nr:sulfide/dihydroorotate dehydrogenase-like FAD/NAD-binding protein [Clostridium sp.]MDY6013135.1 sulfide/dihydroorotate dehydrogenase-like FAD/NAD-binding protein [Clostridium sp.]
MYKIVSKRELAYNIYFMEIESKRVAKSAKPGQFVIVRSDEKSERIPLTISDFDKDKGTVSIVFQVVGQGTKELSDYEVGDYVKDFVGPLGKPSEFIDEDLEKLRNQKIVFIAGGVGAAPIYPQVKWMKDRKIDVDVILGSRSKKLLILEDELRKVSNNLYIATDDGSYGFNGRVTDMLNYLVKQKKKNYDKAIVIGPMIMMKFMCNLTKELDIPTTVSLNPIMIDGTGMCGACRVTVGDEIKFACVDGPEFDGHLVNFDEAMRRQNIYKTEEGRAFLKEKEGDSHHGGCGHCGGEK